MARVGRVVIRLAERADGAPYDVVRARSRRTGEVVGDITDDAA
ncbi:hypothetical protein [Streptomyces sp. CBMA152]|nr:hypothetical protein [Streptomyces sp. CBMA152]